MDQEHFELELEDLLDKAFKYKLNKDDIIASFEFLISRIKEGDFDEK